MTEPATPVTPTAIKLHRKSRMLEIAFSDDTHFLYPCEYLRVLAPDDGSGDSAGPVHGKRGVSVTHIEPLGTTALQLAFDDGYSCGFSWQELHALGADHDRNWAAYLQALDAQGLDRGEAGISGRTRIKLLYFIQLAKLTGRDEEEVELPDTVTHVESLLAWLGDRHAGWQEPFAPDRVQVTVNRHFAEPYTLIEDGDEVAIVPRSMQE
ncbi:MAG TPA: gamma-butyrobetaine hydroxylase-like domain-containing protein [Gammaproteobacteria bacterium]|nr:gamma-butyrobetaine hydroxylase-like domain-containing protein [Gammaproteobacteria bacterium]